MTQAASSIVGLAGEGMKEKKIKIAGAETVGDGFAAGDSANYYCLILFAGLRLAALTLAVAD